MTYNPEYKELFIKHTGYFKLEVPVIIGSYSLPFEIDGVEMMKDKQGQVSGMKVVSKLPPLSFFNKVILAFEILFS